MMRSTGIILNTSTGVFAVFLKYSLIFFYAVCMQKTQTAQTVGDLISVASGFA